MSFVFQTISQRLNSSDHRCKIDASNQKVGHCRLGKRTNGQWNICQRRDGQWKHGTNCHLQSIEMTTSSFPSFGIYHQIVFYNSWYWTFQLCLLMSKLFHETFQGQSHSQSLELKKLWWSMENQQGTSIITCDVSYLWAIFTPSTRWTWIEAETSRWFLN